MALIEWTEELSVHISEIDNQHKGMVDIINRLYRSMQEGLGDAALEPIFEDLVEYTQTHFVREEQIMDEHDYPMRALHKKEHGYLTMQLAKIKSEYEHGTGGVSVSLLLFLRDWLVKHIKETDKMYSDYLNSLGVN